MDFIAVSSIFSYFADYEIPFNDGFVEKSDFLNAALEASLPFIYTASMINNLFADLKNMDFFSLCLSIYAYRIFYHFS